PARTLAAFLHEHANLRAARLGVDHAEHLRVGDKRRAGKHFAAVLFEKQHTVDADLVTRLRVDPVDLDDRAGYDLHLAATALDDSKHVYRLLCEAGKTLGYTERAQGSRLTAHG